MPGVCFESFAGAGGVPPGLCAKLRGNSFHVPRKLKEFYVKRLEEMVGKDKIIEIWNDGDELYVEDNALNITFIEFVRQAFDSSFRSGQSLYPAIRKVFKIHEESKRYRFTIDEFAMYYIDATKARRGSTLTKISSTLRQLARISNSCFRKVNPDINFLPCRLHYWNFIFVYILQKRTGHMLFG